MSFFVRSLLGGKNTALELLRTMPTEATWWRESGFLSLLL